MFNKIVKAFRSAVDRGIDSRSRYALFKVADMVSDRYPNDWSLHQIVRDIKENGIRTNANSITHTGEQS